jgi:predicted dithiol-disulfide oxidoreductase (DUF899 family)
MKKPTATGNGPKVVAPEEWAHARAELLAAEKAVTHAEDSVAAQRRRLPMVKFRADYAFATPQGTVSLLDLFGEQSQLLLYQFMDTGPERVCSGCTWFTDGIPANGLVRLAQAGASWATVSDMPLEQMQRVWERQRWLHIPFASSRGTTFSADCGASNGFLLSVFLRQGDSVYRTYTTTQRGVDRLVFANGMRDLLPFGRQEEWEDSPPGYPQRPTWWVQELAHPYHGKNA